MGVVVGAACVFVGNYYFILKNNNNIKETDTDTSINKRDRSSELSFDKRVELLNKLLHGVETGNLNILLVACLTQGFSRAKLEKFMRVLKRLATEYNINFMYEKTSGAAINMVYPLDMNHVTLALEEVLYGSKAYSHKMNSEDMLNTAIHEAGHAVAIVENENLILHHASIIGRAKSEGRTFKVYRYEAEKMTIEDYKEKIIINLCGGVAEQLFGFYKSWYAKYNQAKIKDAIDFSQLDLSVGLDDFLARYSIRSDIENACKSLRAIVKLEMKQLTSSQNDIDSKEQVHQKMHKILEECYQKAVALLTLHKVKIEKIAQLLMRSDIVSGDEIYNFFGKVRPLYAFEVK